jgi:nucleotide-binding universal stress UspA family protein
LKILIGYDGSKDAKATLKDLARAGLPAKAQALVLTVTMPWEPGGPWGRKPVNREASRIAAESLSQAADLAEEAAGILRGLFPGWTVSTDSVIDSPAQGLLTRAESWKPDLMVLGRHGRTALGRLLMGSVSQKVMHHAQADLRIVRPRKREDRKAPRVLVAVDGSEGSDRAVAAAASRMWPKGTRIRVLAALDGVGLLDALGALRKSRVAGGSGTPGKDWVERKSDAAVSRLAAAGHKAEPKVLVGDPRIVILREAREWEADCIFLGSRGLDAVERFVLGSVSSSVATHAPCTVEIVRKGPGSRPPRMKT